MNSEQERLEAAAWQLDQLPRETLARMLRDLEFVDPALSTMVDLAQNSDDPAVRDKARTYVDDNGFGVLLIDEFNERLTDLDDA